MTERKSVSSPGRLIAMAKSLWDLYWLVVVPGALWVDGKLKDRKRRRRARRKRAKDKDSKRAS